MELQGPSDGCQHIPYEGREQLEVPDFALMMAPRPLLILSGKYDFVDLCCFLFVCIYTEGLF